MSDVDDDEIYEGSSDEHEGEEPEDYLEDGGDGDMEDSLNLKQTDPQMKRTHSFEVLTEEAVTKNSKELIEGVMEFLGIPNRAIAACLLRAYKYVVHFFTLQKWFNN